MEFDVTTLTPDNRVAAKHVNISTNMEDINLLINEKTSISYNYAGRVILNPNNVTYDNQIPISKHLKYLQNMLVLKEINL